MKDIYPANALYFRANKGELVATDKHDRAAEYSYFVGLSPEPDTARDRPLIPSVVRCDEPLTPEIVAKVVHAVQAVRGGARLVQRVCLPVAENQ